MTRKILVFPRALFGRLTVQERLGTRTSDTGKTAVTMWRCTCTCGKTAVVSNANLTKGLTNSCGCIRVEQLVLRNTKHGRSRTPMYKVWLMMVQRCTNPKIKNWDSYGGRGIEVDPAWRKYETFFADMGATYKPGLTIERTNNDGLYSRENCVWATYKVQGGNKRSTVRFVLGGETLCLEEAARRLGVGSAAIRYWRRKGLSDQEIEARFSGESRPPGTSLPRSRRK